MNQSHRQVDFLNYGSSGQVPKKKFMSNLQFRQMTGKNFVKNQL